MRLLVVEDESQLRAQVVEVLSRRGYAVLEAADGQEGLYQGSEYPLDLAIVDLGLPKLSGIEVVRRWRAQDKTFPILILTARANWQDKVEGLEAGADDYLVKPFHVEELMARINALLRRSAGFAKSVIEFGPIRLDCSAKLVYRQGEALELTAYEYNTLEYLMLHPGAVVSKQELTEHLYAQDFDRDSNVIEVFIGRLRKKLDPDGRLKPIVTLRGQGYRFDPPGA